VSESPRPYAAVKLLACSYDSFVTASRGNLVTARYRAAGDLTGRQWRVIRMWRDLEEARRGAVYALHETVRMKSSDRATLAVI
jgi:hypothetical protein